ncbi:MAG TPA: hypothetical protein VD731_03045 [Nitrosopumilaceae archaeon]|nr:hypothetical protein [Nitrosopumilaceae archaeon]
MKKEFALIMVSCVIGISNAYGDPQINLEQAPAQTDPPLTITDDTSNVLFRVLSDGQAIINEFIQFSGSGLTALRTYVFPDSSGTVVLEDTSQTLTLKTIDADSNNISNIDDNEIKTAAGIDVTKLSSGSVDNTEFDYLDGVTSDIQAQLDSKIVPSIVRLGSDVSTTTTSCCVDATGLSFSVTSGKVYHFKFLVRWDSSAGNIGTGLTLNGPTVTFLTYDVIYPISTTAGVIHGRNLYNSATVVTNSPATSNNLGIIEGLIQPSADGTLIVRFMADSTPPGGSVTIKANSVGFLTEIP